MNAELEEMLVDPEELKTIDDAGAGCLAAIAA